MGDVVWYISRENKQHGPFNRDDFERFEREGQLLPSDYIWCTGVKDWIAYRDYRNTSVQDTLAAQSPSASSISRLSGLYVLFRTATRLPISLIRTAFNLVTRPTAFGGERIDRKPGDLQRATTFYLNMFAVAFLSFSLLAYFHGFSGASEARLLVELSIQLTLALPILGLLNFASRQSVRFSGVVQGALYAVGMFLVATISISALIAYATPLPEMGRGELDIISTEYEKCLVGQSRLYWLMRGDLQFYMRPNVTPFTIAIDFVRDYDQYVVVLPFCVIFGKLLNGRYAANSLFSTIFAFVAFAAVATGWELASDKAQKYITNSSTCWTTFFQQASKKYNTEILGKQIAYRINKQFANQAKVYHPAVNFVGGKFVMQLNIHPTVKETPERMDLFRRGGLLFYCENNTDFVYARQLRIPLQFIVRRHDGSIIVNQEVAPADCSRHGNKQ